MGTTAPRRNQKRPHQLLSLAVGYARVSTIDQAEEGVSLEAQVAAIQRYAAARDLCLDPPRGIVARGDRLLSIYPAGGVLVDGGISGGTPIDQRPMGARLADLVRGRFVSHLVVTKLDRLSRSDLDFLGWREELRRNGVALHILDMGGQMADTAAGDLMTGMLASFGQMLRRQIGDHTRGALAHKRSKGEKLGGLPPYGKSVYVNAAGVKCLRDCPGEQAVIRRALELRATGLSYRGIGRQLFEEGLRPRNGGPWSHRSICNILERAE
jgi:DNA invertase Pin-like site-specific DNA recombinase